MGLFDKIKNGLKKTKDSMMRQVESLVHSTTTIDDDFYEELEETLIMADVGVSTSTKIVERLRELVDERKITDTDRIMSLLKEIVSDMVAGESELKMTTKPAVILVIGVNGVGKTTTIGKLAAGMAKYKINVLMAAADTFRAAAAEQLQIWADRSGADIVRHKEGADPAAVVFDAISAAKARHSDVIIIDTAGRLHNKQNLMQELKKINRVIDRELPDADKETLLVLDATTGQNAVAQAKQFKEVVGLTGIILTKLDGTARGGIVISIKEELGLPVKYIGVGEQVDDLQPFVPKDFVDALFEE
jgi:fused signal recognition particle receptor